jgi:hypothetical protein
MGRGESQIGYLASDITLHSGGAPRLPLTHRRRVVACALYVAGAGKLIVGNGSRRHSAVILIEYPMLFESLTMIRRSMRNVPTCTCEYVVCECYGYMRYSCGFSEPDYALEFDDDTDVRLAALIVQREDDG